jgi:hypothetical protein
VTGAAMLRDARKFTLETRFLALAKAGCLP